MAALGALLADAYEDRLIPANPAAGVRITGTGEAAEKRALSDAEIGLFLGALPEGRERLMGRLMIACGLRSQEVRALQWADLGPERVKVRRAVKVDGSLGPPKSKAGVRELAIPTELRRELLEMGRRAGPGRRISCSGGGRAADEPVPTEPGDRPGGHGGRGRLVDSARAEAHLRLADAAPARGDAGRADGPDRPQRPADHAGQ